MPVLDFSKSIWNNSMDGEWNAVSVTNTVAINTATNINVLGLSRQVSASEWSYTSQFYGPSIKCNEPNSTQQAIFNNITKYYEEKNIFTYSDQNDNRTNRTLGVGSGRLIYSSWSSVSIFGCFDFTFLKPKLIPHVPFRIFSLLPNATFNSHFPPKVVLHRQLLTYRFCSGMQQAHQIQTWHIFHLH